MLYTSLNAHDIRDIMKNSERDNFSIATYQAYIDMIDNRGLFEEFDAVAFDCTFEEINLSSCTDVDNLINDYGYLLDDIDDLTTDEKLESLIDLISNKTFVLLHDNDYFTFDFIF